jgi:hypothetical protein
MIARGEDDSLVSSSRGNAATTPSSRTCGLWLGRARDTIDQIAPAFAAALTQIKAHGERWW